MIGRSCYCIAGGMTDTSRLNQYDPEADSRTAGLQILNGFVEHNMVYIYTISMSHIRGGRAKPQGPGGSMK